MKRERSTDVIKMLLREFYYNRTIWIIQSLSGHCTNRKPSSVDPEGSYNKYTSFNLFLITETKKVRKFITIKTCFGSQTRKCLINKINYEKVQVE